MKLKKIVTIVITVLAVGMVGMSGVMKLAGSADIIKMLNAVGVGEYRTHLGIAEILFAALFAYPKTMKIGLLLLTGYFGGALATELSHHMMLNALTPLVLISLAAVLRDRFVMLPTPAIQSNTL